MSRVCICIYMYNLITSLLKLPAPFLCFTVCILLLYYIIFMNLRDVSEIDEEIKYHRDNKNNKSKKGTFIIKRVIII